MNLTPEIFKPLNVVLILPKKLTLSIMGKSYRKTPIMGYAGSSEKKDKQIANGKFRKKSKQSLEQFDLDDLPYELNEVHDEWSMTKDGKCYLKPHTDYYKSGKWRRK